MAAENFEGRTLDLLHDTVEILAEGSVAGDKHVHAVLANVLELFGRVDGALVQNAASVQCMLHTSHSNQLRRKQESGRRVGESAPVDSVCCEEDEKAIVVSYSGATSCTRQEQEAHQRTRRRFQQSL
jgi:NAD(P)-dependent dehydrogenase (short-subunit alcohol dehydrogenase family)